MSRPGKDESTVRAILRHRHEAVPDDRLAHLVKDTLRGLTRALQTRLREHSVLFGHWVFFRILWEKDGLTQTELSEEAGLMLPTTFSALKTMERLGYIYRQRRPDNRKKIYIFLTPKGRALKDVLVPLAEEVNAIAVKGVPASDVAATRRTLLAMIENLAKDEIDLVKMERKFPSTRDLVHLISDGSDRPKRGRATAPRAPHRVEASLRGKAVAKREAARSPGKRAARKRAPAS